MKAIKKITEPPNILLIDDNTVVAGIILHMFEHLGYKPKHASTAIEALELLGQKKLFQLILMNLSQTHQGGVLEKQLASLYNQGTPVVVYTSKSIVRDYKQAYSKSSDSWVSEFKFAQLLKPKFN